MASMGLTPAGLVSFVEGALVGSGQDAFPRLKGWSVSKNAGALGDLHACEALGRLSAHLQELQVLNFNGAGITASGFVAFMEQALAEAGQEVSLPRLKRLDLTKQEDQILKMPHACRTLGCLTARHKALE